MGELFNRHMSSRIRRLEWEIHREGESMLRSAGDPDPELQMKLFREQVNDPLGIVDDNIM